MVNSVHLKFMHCIKLAIDNLNKWRNANLLKLPLDTSSLNSNARLAGFIDTDGHFSMKLAGCYGSD
jgi:hypothetical protein